MLTLSVTDNSSNPPNTLGVQNINARFSKAGGTEKGTPAVASTLGSADKEDTAHYHENNVASGKSSSRSDSKLSNKSEKKSGSLPGKPPGKGQEQKGAEDADANAADRKGQTGREGSHGNGKFPLLFIGHLQIAVHKLTSTSIHSKRSRHFSSWLAAWNGSCPSLLPGPAGAFRQSRWRACAVKRPCGEGEEGETQSSSCGGVGKACIEGWNPWICPDWQPAYS